VQQILIGNKNAERDLKFRKIALFVTNKKIFALVTFLHKYSEKVMHGSLHGTC
jgi:hypothetical protein